MKITLKQKRKIIREAIKELKLDETYLCHILGEAIEKVLGIQKDSVYQYKSVQKYIPKFQKSVAIKYFNAKRHYVWWETDEVGQALRLAFLKYLLTGKLPAKKRGKK